MKNFKSIRRSSAHVVFGLLILANISCGKSPDGTPVTAGNNTTSGIAAVSPVPTTPVLTSCASGAVNIAGLGCLTGTFDQVCVSLPSATLTTASGQRVCRLRRQYTINFVGSNNYLARLSPSDASGASAFQSGIRVFANDKVDVSASGGWGSISYDYKSRLGGLIQTWTPTGNCNQVRVDGKSVSEGSAVTNNENGENAGLWMSDGTQAYFVGSHAKNTMVNEGLLHFGVNAPADGQKCGTISISSIVIDHCENSSGTSISCY